MSSHVPLRPDPMPLREALRGLRFMLRRGGETFAETITVDGLPKPAVDLAGAVLREVEGIARNVDAIASGFAKQVLGGHDPRTATLEAFGADASADARFAAAVYVALRSVLRRLDAAGVFVSEAAARRAWGRGQPTDAATLTIRLLNERVVRGTTADEAARVAGSALEPVAIFAVMLWLQSARSEDENEAALDAATDIAVALAAEVAQACAARDAGRIAALYDRYAAHV